MAHIHPYCSEIANKKVERIGDVTVGRGSARINFGCQLIIDPWAAQSDVILAGGRYEMPTVSAPTRIYVELFEHLIYQESFELRSFTCV